MVLSYEYPIAKQEISQEMAVSPIYYAYCSICAILGLRLHRNSQSRHNTNIKSHQGCQKFLHEAFDRNGERMFHTLKDLRSHVSRSISREERNIQKPSRTVGYLRSEQRVGERRVTRARFFPMLQEFRRAEGLNANRTERNGCARWS